MQKKDSFTSLREMMFLVQIEEFFDNFNKQMKEERRKNFREFIKALVPLCVGGIASLVTFNPWFFCLGIGGLGILTIRKTIRDMQEEEQRMRKNDEKIIQGIERALNRQDENSEPEKIIDISRKLPVDETKFGITPIVKHQDSDFYTEIIKEKMAEELDETTKAEMCSTTPNLEIIGHEKTPSKEEVQAKIVHEYELYCIAYKIPTMDINAKEWDILFDTVYERLSELNITEQFYSFMNFLLKYVLSYSLVNHDKRITIYSFIQKIPKLEILGFDSREAESLEKEIDSKITPPEAKVVDLKILKFPNK